MGVLVDARQVAVFYYWIAAGTRYRGVATIDAVVRDKGPAELLDWTAAYWRAWLRQGCKGLASLPTPLQRLYRRSLLVIRTQIDHDGAVIAANDSDVLQFGRACLEQAMCVTKLGARRPPSHCGGGERHL